MPWFLLATFFETFVFNDSDLLLMVLSRVHNGSRTIIWAFSTVQLWSPLTDSDGVVF